MPPRVRKRKSDGRFYAVVDRGIRDGKRDRKYVYARTKEKAEELLLEELKKKADGLRPTDGRLTVGEYLDQWLTEYVKHRRRANTYASYSADVRLRLKPALGHVRLSQLSPRHVQRFMNGLKEGRLATSSANKALETLRTALQQAVAEETLARNVARLVKPLEADVDEEEDAQPRALSDEQTAKLLEAARGERLEGLWVLLVTRGLRISEALGLTWADVDLERRQLHVRMQLAGPAGGWSLAPVKTKRGRRSMDLPQVTLEALQRHRARQLEERLLAGSRWTSHGLDLVFRTRTGIAFGRHKAYQSFRSFVQRRELASCTVHELRHTCATLLLAEGVPPREVMELLGHSSIVVTLNLYGHVLAKQRANSAHAIDRLFGGLRT